MIKSQRSNVNLEREARKAKPQPNLEKWRGLMVAYFLDTVSRAKIEANTNEIYGHHLT